VSSVSHRIIFADVLDGLRSLPSGSVNCVATSPPYWGLRDYGRLGLPEEGTLFGDEALGVEFVALEEAEVL